MLASLVNRAACSAPPAPRAREAEPNVGADVPDYTGPKDGLSHPRHTWLMRPLNRAVIAGRFRLVVEGRENLPTSGPNVYCPTHPSMFDPPLVPAAVNTKDMRFMANKFVFDGLRGRLMTWGGAFPVDREKPSLLTCRHSLEVLRQGADLCVFPEGSLPDEHKEGRIGAIKKGPAAFALRSGVASIVPLAIHYRPDNLPRYGEKSVGALAAAAVTAAGLTAAVVGGPTVQAVASAVTTAMTSAFVAGRVAHRATSEPEWNNRRHAVHGTGVGKSRRGSREDRPAHRPRSLSRPHLRRRGGQGRPPQGSGSFAHRCAAPRDGAGQVGADRRRLRRPGREVPRYHRRIAAPAHVVDLTRDLPHHLAMCSSFKRSMKEGVPSCRPSFPPLSDAPLSRARRR
ncbi:MAG: 1-acyl-sn-glycerol-3-phosphate acyltransferase [Proteobacteria bacterium]|nr:1-acyl-sn-glycerol-3-phosphate acyltransferase [Pseudomonadota bacterium]